MRVGGAALTDADRLDAAGSAAEPGADPNEPGWA